MRIEELRQLNRGKLLNLARRRGVVNAGKMTNPQLIELLAEKVEGYTCARCLGKATVEENRAWDVMMRCGRDGCDNDWCRACEAEGFKDCGIHKDKGIL